MPCPRCNEADSQAPRPPAGFKTEADKKGWHHWRSEQDFFYAPDCGGFSADGDAAAQQSANFVVEMVLDLSGLRGLSYSLAEWNIILIRKRREIGDGPI
jgi:hypothetical protein